MKVKYKTWVYKIPKFWLRSAHHEVKLFKLCDWISQQNRKRIQKYCVSRCLFGFESWKHGYQKSCDILPSKKVRDIQIFKKLRGVHHTAKSTPWCASQRGVKKTNYLESQSPGCASHHRFKLHTAESESKILIVSGCFKRDYQEKSF